MDDWLYGNTEGKTAGLVFWQLKVWGIPGNPAPLHNPTVTQQLVWGQMQGRVGRGLCSAWFPQGLSRGAAGRGKGKAAREAPSSHILPAEQPGTQLLSPLQPWPVISTKHEWAHRGSGQGVRIPGSSPPVCPSPPPALPVTKSFSDFESQAQPRQGEDRSGPPISQSSPSPKLQSCPQGQNCLAIPVNSPRPMLQTPCQQARGLILSPRQSS